MAAQRRAGKLWRSHQNLDDFGLFCILVKVKLTKEKIENIVDYCRKSEKKKYEYVIIGDAQKLYESGKLGAVDLLIQLKSAALILKGDNDVYYYDDLQEIFHEIGFNYRDILTDDAVSLPLPAIPDAFKAFRDNLHNPHKCEGHWIPKDNPSCIWRLGNDLKTLSSDEMSRLVDYISLSAKDMLGVTILNPGERSAYHQEERKEAQQGPSKLCDSLKEKGVIYRDEQSGNLYCDVLVEMLKLLGMGGHVNTLFKDSRKAKGSPSIEPQLNSSNEPLRAVTDRTFSRNRKKKRQFAGARVQANIISWKMKENLKFRNILSLQNLYDELEAESRPIRERLNLVSELKDALTYDITRECLFIHFRMINPSGVCTLRKLNHSGELTDLLEQCLVTSASLSKLGVESLKLEVVLDDVELDECLEELEKLYRSQDQSDLFKRSISWNVLLRTHDEIHHQLPRPRRASFGGSNSSSYLYHSQAVRLPQRMVEYKCGPDYSKARDSPSVEIQLDWSNEVAPLQRTLEPGSPQEKHRTRSRAVTGGTTSRKHSSKRQFDVELLCHKKEISFDGRSTLTVHPYYKQYGSLTPDRRKLTLDLARYRELSEISESSNFIKLVTQTVSIRNKFAEYFRPKFISITEEKRDDQTELIMSRDETQSYPDHCNQQEAWQNLSDLVESFFKQLAVKSIRLRDEVWKTLSKEMNTLIEPSLVTVEPFPDQDSAFILLNVAGLEPDVDVALDVLEQRSIFEHENLERKSKKDTAIVKLPKSYEGQFLLQCDFVKNLEEKVSHSHLEVTLSRSGMGPAGISPNHATNSGGRAPTPAQHGWEVQFYGVQGDRDIGQNYMFKLLHSLKSWHKSVEPLVIELLQEELVLDKLHAKLKENHILAAIDVRPNQRITAHAADEEMARSALEKTLIMIQSAEIPLVDQERVDVAGSDAFRDLLDGFVAAYGPLFTYRIGNTVELAGDIQMAMEHIENYLSQNAVYKHAFTADAGALKYVKANDEELQRFLHERCPQVLFQLPEKTGEEESTRYIRIEGTRDAAADAVRKLEREFQTLGHEEWVVEMAGLTKHFGGQKGMELLGEIGIKTQTVVELGKISSVTIPYLSRVANDQRQSLSNLPHTRRFGRINVSVVLGDIVQRQDDVLVNAANENLSHGGGIALALSKAAGPSMQQACRDYIDKHRKLKAGEVFFSGSYRLACKAVAHAVGPYNDGSGYDNTALMKVVHECLQVSDRKGYKSICIPAISSGVFGVPVDESTATVVKSVVEFARKFPDSTLCNIYLIDNVHLGFNSFLRALDAVQSDSLTVSTYCPPEVSPYANGQPRRDPYSNQPRDKSGGVFESLHEGWRLFSGAYNTGTETEAANQAGDGSAPRRSDDTLSSDNTGFEEPPVWTGISQTDLWEPVPIDSLPFRWVDDNSVKCFQVTVTTVEGELALTDCDVMVNTTAEDYDLKKSTVSSTLMAESAQKTGGDGLQQELFSKRDQGATVAQGHLMLTTQSHGLPCQFVCHAPVANGDWGPGPKKVITDYITSCLKFASSKGLASVAIPAIGTGALQYPADAVAVSIYDAVKDFARAQGTGGSVEKVFLVVYPGDRFACEGFRAALQLVGSNGDTVPVPGGISSSYIQQQPEPEAPDFAFFDQGEDEIPEKLLGAVGGAPREHFEVEEDIGLRITVGNLKIEALEADITMEKTDAIVNSYDEHMSLGGGVARAIIRKGGPSIEAACKTKKGEMKKKKMIKTTAGLLECKKIFHVAIPGPDEANESKWKELIHKVLIAAQKDGLKSITLPAFGTGQRAEIAERGLDNSSMARIMYEVINKFALSGSCGPLTNIRIVTTDHSVAAIFSAQLRRLHEEKVVSAKPGFFQRVKKKFGVSKDQATAQPMTEMERVFKTRFVIYYKDEAHLKRAKTELRIAFNKIVKSKKRNWMDYDDLKEEERNLLLIQFKEMGWDSEVKVDFDEMNCELIFYGLGDEVFDVMTKVDNDLRRVSHGLQKAQKTRLVYQIVHWAFFQRGIWERFPPEMNYNIHEHFLRWEEGGPALYKHRQGSKTSVINFQNKEMYDEQHPMRKVRIQRLGEMSANSGSVPSDWKKSDQVEIVPLDPNSDKFKEVQGEFEASSGSIPRTIMTISSVQNVDLWELYQRRKTVVEKNMQNRWMPTERKLFHGATESAVNKICRHNFNRSYSGRNATSLGEGVYFARDSSYSAQDAYSVPNDNSEKFILFSLVATGDLVAAERGMRTLPEKTDPNTGLSAGFYHCAVDDMDNPGIFVIFDDVQAYPAYIIKFK